MVRSGIVTSVSMASNSGIIQDLNGTEFFFNIDECCENELPNQWATVTFVKDKDFKTTNVASLIKVSPLFDTGFAS